MDLVKLDVHHGRKVKPKNTKEPIIHITKYDIWKPKVNQNMLEEELMSGFCCDNILTRCQKSILRKQSTTLKTNILPCLFEGKHDIKSRRTNSQGLSRVGKVLQLVWMVISFGRI